MAAEDLLKGKKILIVDDETDVLESLEELLFMCDVSRASNFEDAKAMLENGQFDIAILDIMGVNGFDLLAIASKKKITAVMLTANALSPENTYRAYEEGAALYVPKDEMVHIAIYLTDVLEAQKEGKHPWWRWLDRLGSFYNKKFGADWREKHEGLWKGVKHHSNRD